MALGDYGRTLASQPLSPAEILELRTASVSKREGEKSYATRNHSAAQALMSKRMLKGMDRDERGKPASFHSRYRITPIGEAALRGVDRDRKATSGAPTKKRKVHQIGKRVV